MGKKIREVELPKSPTSMKINLVALGCFFVCLWYVITNQVDSFWGAIVCMFSLAIPIIVLEFVFLKPFKYASSGLDFSLSDRISPVRVFVKLLGLAGTVGFIALLYWIFAHYSGDFYKNYWRLAMYLLWILLLAAPPYFTIMDKYLIKKKDTYYQMGMLLLGEFRQIDPKALGNHIRGWMIKGFYIPLMFLFLMGNITFHKANPFVFDMNKFHLFYNYAYNLIFTVDLVFVAVGYLVSLRIFDSHIRTAEPSFLGWFVALFCYKPYWDFFYNSHIHYGDGYFWGHMLGHAPGIYKFWGFTILGLLCIYGWATIPFGIRFSNLTNRGILTNGPYRFTKHPAYVAKNISWWMIDVPFIHSAGLGEAVKHSLLLLGVNFIYFMRARTEERHLSVEPEYVQYAEYIDQKGIFRWVGRWFPILRYKKDCLFNYTENDESETGDAAAAKG